MNKKNFTQLLLCSLLLIVGCGDEKHDPEKTLKTTTDCNIRVGITPDQVPFSFIAEGKFVGFEIDITEELGKYLKCDIIFENLPFYSLIPSLQSGKISLIVANLSKTPQRAEIIDFSDNYYINAFGLLFRHNNFDEANPIKENMKIGVQAGTTTHQWLQNSGLKIDLIAMDKIVELVEELESEHLDSVLLDAVNARFLAKEEKLSFMPMKDVNQTGIAMATRKGDPLLNKVNEAILALKKGNIIEKFKQKWGL